MNNTNPMGLLCGITLMICIIIIINDDMNESAEPKRIYSNELGVVTSIDIIDEHSTHIKCEKGSFLIDAGKLVTIGDKVIVEKWDKPGTRHDYIMYSWSSGKQKIYSDRN